ncbi:MAG: FAD-dependent oxidoreductase, partial [Myxococcota bacterium]|nr:FAD-dependent oxidoreductase [Myxococcota bacterium]
MRSALFTVMCAALLVTPGAHANPSGEVQAAMEAMSAWNMGTARRAVRRVEQQAPGAPTTLLVKGQYLFFDGRYDEATDLLERAAAALGQDGGFAAHLAAVSRAVGDETRGYASRHTSGGHFVIRWAPGVDEVLVPWMDRVLEAAWETLTVHFGQVPEAPVRVEIYPRAETLAAVTSLTEDEIRQSGTIALCKYNRLMITSPRDLVYGYPWADTLAHEFIHMLITQRSQNTVPIWLHEGLAKYYEVLWRGADPQLDVASETLLARALSNDTLISFDAMSPSMAKLPSQDATATAFAEVHTVVDFLRGRHGDDLPRALTSAMASGKSDREAVAELAKMPWSRFEPAWRSHLKRRGLKTHKERFDTRLLFKGHDTEADELALLKGDKARQFVWLGDRLTLRERHLAAVKEYRKSAAAVGEAVPLIQAKLGRGLLALNRVEEAIEELNKALDRYPEYMLIRLYLGEAWWRQGDMEQALGHLEAAVLIKQQGRALDPGGIGKALAEKARSMGVAFERRRIEGLVPEAEGRWRLETDSGPIPARRVVLALGAWSGALLRPLGPRVPLEAERGYHLVFRDPG